MDIAHQLVVIFCQLDDFCKEFEQHTQHYLLPGASKGPRGPACSLTTSETMVILVMFQMIKFRNFKTFYEGFLRQYWQPYFPNLPSYPRFIVWMKRAIFPMAVFTQCHSGKRTGIYYVDSSGLPVCHLKRSKRHKTFKSIAHYGRTSIGWFFGLKLHLVINNLGQLIAFKMTRGHKNDAVSAQPLFKSLQGLAFGDKGYIGKKLFDTLFQSGLKLITRSRKNMKAPLPLSDYEKQLLNQRNLIETVINHLKHHYQVWHTRHRSIINAVTHLIAALAAYTIEPLKLSAIKLITETHN